MANAYQILCWVVIIFVILFKGLNCSQSELMGFNIGLSLLFFISLNWFIRSESMFMGLDDGLFIVHFGLT